MVNIPCGQTFILYIYFKGEILMEKNENQIGKIEKFFNRIQNDKTISNFVAKGIAIILTIILCSILVVEVGGIRAMYGYPDAEYKYLSTEIKKVIVDSSVDIKRISGDDITSTVTYNTDAGESDWSSAEIKLTKKLDAKFSDATVSATIKKDNGTLNIEDITYSSKLDHYMGSIVASLFIVIICFAVSVLIGYACYFIFFGAVWILKSIEKMALKRRKTI